AESEQAVVIHSCGNHLEAVGDDLAGNQTVAHALVAHHDPIGDGGRTEDLWNRSASPDALAPLAGESIKMGITRGNLTEERSNADDRAVEIFVKKANRAKHRPVGRPAYAFRSDFTAEPRLFCHRLLLRSGSTLGTSYSIGSPEPHPLNSVFDFVLSTRYYVSPPVLLSRTCPMPEPTYQKLTPPKTGSRVTLDATGRRKIP